MRQVLSSDFWEKRREYLCASFFFSWPISTLRTDERSLDSHISRDDSWKSPTFFFRLKFTFLRFDFDFFDPVFSIWVKFIEKACHKLY